MAKKQISELSTGAITSNNDAFIIDTFEGTTVKIPYAVLARMILQTSLEAGTGISLSADETSDIFKIVVSATGGSNTGTTWFISATTPTEAEIGDIWLHTDDTNYGDIDEYDGSYWVNKGNMKGDKGDTGDTGAAGQDGVTPHIDTTTKHWMIGNTDTGVVAEGQKGIKGDSGDDGASISATVSTITGGHKVTISSTDQQISDVTFDVMDGTEIIQTTSDTRTVALTVAGWAGATAPYSQTVSFIGMTSSVVPEIGVSISSTVETGLEQQKQWSYITRAESGTDTITFYCYETKPTIDLTAIVKVV